MFGNQPAVGVDNFTEFGDFAGMIGSGFHHGHLMLWRHGEQCFGHTDMVIEITFGEMHVEFTAEHGCRELFVVVFPLVPVICTMGVPNCLR